MIEKKFYVYIYFDPRKPGIYQYGDYTFDFEPFYVGKGQSDQYISHLKECKSYDIAKKYMNSHKFYKIKNILKEGLEPIILKVEDKILEQESFELEIWLIWAIGGSDLGLGPLTNFTEGGEGVSNPSKESRIKISKANKGKKRTEETRRKISIEAKKRIGSKNSFFGKHYTEENKKKHSDKISGIKNINFGKPIPEETRIKISKANKGQISWIKGLHHSESTKLKISKANKGKKRTEETKRKMSESRKGEKSCFFGKNLLNETKMKISKSNKGKKRTEETKRKISESHKNPSIETRKKISDGHKGKCHSVETIRKMSESRKKFNIIRKQK